jgi:nitric oxide synthase oxygenase domain/subunit
VVSSPRISIGPAGCRINRDSARRGWATKKSVFELLCFIRTDGGREMLYRVPRSHRTHSPLTPVASYAGPLSLQTTA